jgi:aminoglycoside phosphotransferase (APT) family kinase protein
MRINSTDRYLKLVIRALETSIVPNLAPGPSSGIAEVIRTVLLELRKRENGSPVQLRARIAEGGELERELRTLLGEPSAGPAAAHAGTDHDPADNFEILVQQHARLTERLAELTARLSALRAGSVTRDRGEAGESLLRQVAEWELSYYERQGAVALPSAPDEEEPDKQALTQDSLELFLNEQRKQDGLPPVAVAAFEQVLGGYGKQTYIARVRQAAGAESEIVIRKTDPLDHMKFGFSTLEQEFHLLRSLAKTDFPAPRPQYLGSNIPGVDGSFFTMPRIPGRVAGTFLGGVSDGNTESMYLQLAELMARLHRMPVETFSDYLNAHGDASVLGTNVRDCYRINLEAWARYTAEHEFLPSPYLNWMFDWLNSHLPDDDRPAVLVHGDFNVHNVLSDRGEVTGVLDWECAGFGAPEQDLAYVRPHIAKHIDWNRFIDHYVKCGGPRLNPDAMKFCLIYSAIRVNLGGNKLTYNLQHGANSDIRYAMVDLGFSQAFMQMGLNA